MNEEPFKNYIKYFNKVVLLVNNINVSMKFYLLKIGFIPKSLFAKVTHINQDSNKTLLKHFFIINI